METLPVKTMTSVVDSISFNLFSVSIPFIVGIFISNITTSKSRSCMFFKVSAPLSQLVTLYPIRVSSFAIIFRNVFSSSVNKMLGFLLIYLYRLIPLTTTTKSCGCDLTFIATNIMCRNWSDIHRLLDEAVEQQSTRSGCSSIKTKHKFVQIIVQMRGSWIVV